MRKIGNLLAALLSGLSVGLMLSGCGSGNPSFTLADQPCPDNRAEFQSFIKRNAPSEDAFVAVQRLVFDAIERKQWDEAASIYRAFKPKFPSMAPRFDSVIALLEAPVDTIPTVSLGDSINTLQDEFLPVITIDGSKLYFCRDNPLSNDDVMVADRVGKTGDPGLWSMASLVPPPIFTVRSEAPTGISPDGNRLLLFGNYDVTDTTDTASASHAGQEMAHRAHCALVKPNLFYSDKQTDGSWGPVHAFPPPINSGYYESDTKMSSDGKELFFVSDRPGGIGEFHPKPRKGESDSSFHGSYWGNTDIYVCTKKEDGSWGQPINLGPKINTPYAERTPFLHPDGKTLYFASEGHPGLGGLDIFKSTRLSDTSWTEWSEPVNLGKSVNTAGADWGYVLSTDGTTAYVTVSNKTLREYDIKSMTIPKKSRPARVATIAGKITDNTGKPIAAHIMWDDLETGKNVGDISSDPTTGKYFIALPLGKNYAYYAQMDGYFPVSKNLDLRGIDSLSGDTMLDIKEDVVLAWIKSLQASDSAIRLNNIFFDFDEATLKPESFPELNRLVAILKITPSVRVEIDAYTDNKGTHPYNLQLSERRAKSVVDYLTGHAIEEQRLSSRGFAESKPVATNETDEGRAMNRRVEFRFPRDTKGVEVNSVESSFQSANTSGN